MTLLTLVHQGLKCVCYTETRGNSCVYTCSWEAEYFLMVFCENISRLPHLHRILTRSLYGDYMQQLLHATMTAFQISCSAQKGRHSLSRALSIWETILMIAIPCALPVP